jgi:hypothetical protein
VEIGVKRPKATFLTMRFFYLYDLFMPITHAIFSGIVPDDALTPIIRFLRHFVIFLILCAIDATSYAVLFGSKPLLDHFGLAAVAQKWRSFFSLVFLLDSSLVILRLADLFNRRVLDKWEDR